MTKKIRALILTLALFIAGGVGVAVPTGTVHADFASSRVLCAPGRYVRISFYYQGTLNYTASGPVGGALETHTYNTYSYLPRHVFSYFYVNGGGNLERQWAVKADNLLGPYAGCVD